MFKDIKSVIPKTIKQAGIDSQIQASKILKLFKSEVEQLLGVNLTKKIRPLYIKNNIIIVASLSPVAAKELKSKEEQILERINKIIGGETVIGIRYLT
jgi:hypothetical protein